MQLELKLTVSVPQERTTPHPVTQVPPVQMELSEFGNAFPKKEPDSWEPKREIKYLVGVIVLETQSDYHSVWIRAYQQFARFTSIDVVALRAQKGPKETILDVVLRLGKINTLLNIVRSMHTQTL